MQSAFRNNTLQVHEVLVSLSCTNIIFQSEQETESQMLYFLPNALPILPAHAPPSVASEFQWTPSPSPVRSHQLFSSRGWPLAGSCEFMGNTSWTCFFYCFHSFFLLLWTGKITRVGVQSRPGRTGRWVIRVHHCYLKFPNNKYSGWKIFQWSHSSP